MEKGADVERLAILAATEEFTEYQHMRTTLGVDGVRMLEHSMRMLEQQLLECEQDRTARLDNMHQLDALLAESEQDRAARLEQMHLLGARLAEAERAQAAYEVIIARQASILACLRPIAVVLRSTKRVALLPYNLVRHVRGERAPR